MSPGKMESLHKSDRTVADPGLQIIRHPPGGSYFRSLFDIRVFYVRISRFTVDDSSPGCLTLNHIPSTPDTVLEVNGIRCSTNSGMSCILRRDRADKKSNEATFIATDSVRLTGGVTFQVLDKDDLVISGALEMSGANGFIAESKSNGSKKWVMKFEPVICADAEFLKGKQIMRGEPPVLPTVEVYVAGCISRTPVVLTKTLQISPMNSIPKFDVPESHADIVSRNNLQVAEYKNCRLDSEEDYDSLYWRQMQYIEGEDGELSWFNAGVRVGVGIGLGVCLGVGIGVGLLVRTYRTTTRTFKRHLL